MIGTEAQGFGRAMGSGDSGGRGTLEERLSRRAWLEANPIIREQNDRMVRANQERKQKQW